MNPLNGINQHGESEGNSSPQDGYHVMALRRFAPTQSSYTPSVYGG